jgi:hypothetical protein
LETDQALNALLTRDVVGGAPIEISFEPPTKAWTSTRKAPAVNVYLHDLRENVARREVMIEPVYDADGKLVGRQKPPQRFDLAYTVSVWGVKPLMEHRLLGALVQCLGHYDVLPRELLPPPLAALSRDVFLSTAQGPKRGMLQAISGDLKASIDLVVTIPIPAGRTIPLAPPVTSPPQIKVDGGEQRETVGGAGQPAAAAVEQPRTDRT